MERNESKKTLTLQRMAKLFRVLVVGGAILAAAAGSVPRGETGNPDSPGDGGDGGVPGW